MSVNRSLPSHPDFKEAAWCPPPESSCAQPTSRLASHTLPTIDEQQRIQLSALDADLLRQIIASSPDCIKVLDLEGNLLFMSPGGQRAFEVGDITAYLNRSWVEMWHRTGCEEVITAFQTAKAGGVGHFQGACPTERGTYRYWDVLITPIVDTAGRVERLLALSRDITAQKDNEAAVRESEERFRKIYQHAPTGIAMSDCDGHLQQCNQAYCDILGYSEEELREVHFSSLIHPDDWPTNLRAIQDLRDGKVSFFEVENRYVRKDGRSVWVHKLVSVLRDSRDVPTHFIALVTDITERQRAEILITSQNRSLEMLVSGAPLSSVLSYLARVVELQTDHHAIASILLLDEEGKLRNGASPSLPEDYLRAIDGLMPRVNVGTCCEAAATGQVVVTPDIEAAPSWEGLKHLPLALGYLAAWSQPLIASDGRVLGTFGTYFRERREPTIRERQAVEILARTASLAIERTRAEEALRNSRQRLETFSGQLEQLVEERTAELVRSQTRLRELASELNLAEQRERKRLATELHDHLQQLLVLSKLKLGQGKRLAKLPSVIDMMQQADEVLTDALSYTRSLVAELSPPVLRQQGLVAGLTWLADWMKRHDLSVSVSTELETVPLPEEHAVLLFQSVRELLINAAKHAKSERAWLDIIRRNGHLCIRVKDAGTGFDEVTAFEQPNGQSSKFGLFSVRERMRALGGSLEIDTAPGRGTTCLLTLPIADKAPVSVEHPSVGIEPSQAATSVPQKTGTISVVLVDDHAMIREGLRAVLANYPDIRLAGEAADGEEAVTLVRQTQPTVVIMDINMPKLNGIEASARIKAEFPHITIIGLSVNAEADYQEAMRKAGAAMLLTKEAAVDELYQALQAVLKRSNGSGLHEPVGGVASQAENRRP